MRLQYRRVLSYFLLATFVSISLLGEGLHWLTPETGQHHHHHHRHGLGVITRTAHDSQHDDHDLHLATHAHACANEAECESTTPRALLVVTDDDVDCHNCKICEYLFQAVSQPVEIAATFESRPLIVAAPSLRRSICSAFSLCIQVPRGPPSLV